MSTERKTADGYVLTPPQVAALEAIEKRLQWPSLHWGVEDVSIDAWPHLARFAADAVVAHIDAETAQLKARIAHLEQELAYVTDGDA